MKKTRINLLALGILATVITTSTPVFAATNTGTSNVGTISSVQVNTINSSTVITKSNLSSVLKYVGINPNDTIESNSIKESNIKTVGELQTAIEQAKEKSKERQNKIATATSNTTTKSSNATISIASDDDTPIDTQNVYHDLDCDSYTVEFSCSGQYRHGQWCGVSDTAASVSSNNSTGNSFKIISKDLSASYTSSKITMYHNIKVKEYITILGIDVPIVTDTIKGYDYFSIEDWV